jgi:PleD family two-component response regulator
MNHSTDTLEPANILLIDDMPNNLRLLSSLLSKQGYKVRSVINGAMGLKAAQAKPPDLILLDINMPDLNGYEVCTKLKEHEVTQEIPVIFLSALDDVIDKVKAFRVGGSDYITKPFQIEEVLVRVQNQLQLRQAQKMLGQQNVLLEQEICDRKKIQASLEERETELKQQTERL